MHTTQLQFATTIAVRVKLREPLLTAHQVAGLLAIPRSSVHDYARRQTDPLPSITVGRHRRFYRSDVDAWLASRRPRPDPGPSRERVRRDGRLDHRAPWALRAFLHPVPPP